MANLYIDGAWVAASSGETSPVINPFDGSVATTADVATQADVEHAVGAARKAFDQSEWRSTIALERAALLERTADILIRDCEEIARAETLNTGKAMRETRWDVSDVANVFRYFAGLADKEAGRVVATGSPTALSRIVYEPVGVCGLISPWNYPLLQISWKVAPALAAGNTIVIKPAQVTPLTTILMVRALEEAGAPPGVVNLVTGPGSRIGTQLGESPDVDLVSLTGGLEAGRSLMRAAAGTVKKVALELGGKSPNIVFADADLDRFGRESPYSVFDNCGQDCCARSRILVERSAHDRVVELFAEGTRNVKVGDPMAETTEVGPLISERQRDRVADYVAVGRDEGAQIVVGGSIPDDQALAAGTYFLPTVFDSVTPEMRIAREEVFGPVVGIIPFDTPEEAVRLANATPYGLAGSIWTRDLTKALRVARGVQSGVLSINSNSSVHTEAPFGGYKRSGIGRELGMHALELYTEVKNVFVDLS
jgi:betaine-aldehyde dehydrogenase